MIIDPTGTPLLPGNGGRDCPGNGWVPGKECCCEECDYMQCCLGRQDCGNCLDLSCPHSPACRPAWVEVLRWLRDRAALWVCGL